MNNFGFRHSGGTSNIAYMDGHVGDLNYVPRYRYLGNADEDDFWDIHEVK